MKNYTIFDVQYCKAALIHEQILKALPFIIKNEQLIVLSDMDIKFIKEIKSYSTTPIYELYTRQLLLNDKILKDFLIFDFTDFKSDIPEALMLLDNIAVDAKYLSGNISDKYRKSWINVTSLTGKRNPITGHLNIVDIPKLHGLFVRNYLTMSYHDSNTWLTPKLLSFIIESYSMTIARLLQRSYNLNPDEYAFIQTVFAFYYAQLLTDQKLTDNLPAILTRCGFLGSMLEITQRLENLEIPKDKLLTITDIIDYIRKHGPKRMSKLEPSYVYRLFSAGSVDFITLYIALDYPPYWVYQLLKLASGIKHPVISTIFRTSNIKKKMDEFIKELVVTPTLEVNR